MERNRAWVRRVLQAGGRRHVRDARDVSDVRDVRDVRDAQAAPRSISCARCRPVIPSATTAR
jgi:hypothetical protein